MAQSKKKFRFFFIFLIFLSPLYFQLKSHNLNFPILKDDSKLNHNDRKEVLRSSDIAGSDLYAEQINAYVAGNKSIIKHSLFTNDTNIFPQFDLNDPAFYKCNALISASNTINPGIFPKLLTESKIGSQYELGFNSFIGFLSYDEEMNINDVQLRAERALEIIKRKFEIDLIMVNVSKINSFIFIGDFPKWDLFFDEITRNLPMDGYWKALDLSRITSKNYYEKFHLSSTFMIINSLSFIEEEPDFSTDQLNFNFQSLDLSYLENLELNPLIDQFGTIGGNFGEIINATISEEELDQFIDVLSSFSLSNESSYTSLMIQYEGLSDGIKKIGINQYEFDLWKSLGYIGTPLAPSEKIYIALVGAFMSDIEINILCTDIVDQTPSNFEFYDYLLEQIDLLMYIAGIEFDIQTLKDYSFELFWVNEEGFKKSYVKPVNLNDPSDTINFFQQLGFDGFPYIPTGIVNPPDDFLITYNSSHSEPNMILKKELIGENASYGAYRDFTYRITAENIGNTTAWGIPTSIPLELNDFFLLLTLGNQPLADEFQNTIWDVVRIEYPNQYNSLESFFNFDKDPLIFYFDSLGIGVYDTFFPNILNFTNLSPYNGEMDHIIDIIIAGYPQLITTLAIIGVTTDELKDTFTNKYSVWNDDNWKLIPGESLSYEIGNVSIAYLDSFKPFYSTNFTINSTPQTPEVISGTTISDTLPEMALSMNNESWIIGSEEIFLKQRIEVDFVFRNDTAIDLVNNNIERVSLIMNFSARENLESLDFEIFNFSSEEFLDMTPYLDSIENNTWTFSFINNNESLNWLFYTEDKPNFTTLFKINGVDSERFNISIDDLDVEFSTREININNDTGSKVLFGSLSGNVEFERFSNSIPLSTYDMSSIIATSYIVNYSSKPGALNTYIIDLKNIGSNTAKNVRINMQIPGIMEDVNEFTLENSNLTYFLPSLAPSEEKTINFSFYSPNTRSISDVLITYDNLEKIQGGNSSQLRSLTNQVYISAPVDYMEIFPFIRFIKFGYDSNTNVLPTIGSEFNLTISLKNMGPNGFRIPDLNISMNDQIGDLRRVNNNSLDFEGIDYDEKIFFNITLKKTDWKAYYYSPINFINGSEGITIQILNSSSIILGKINFSLIKSVNKNQIEIGDEINVSIEIKNTGTITVKDIMVNDLISYSQSHFSLIEGNLVIFINSLKPGEYVSLNYTIRAKRQSFVALRPASIIFYYLGKEIEQSNILYIKIITPQLTQFLYVFIPSLAVLFILAGFFCQNNKHKTRSGELRRIERHLFKMSSRDSVLKFKSTLRERLKIITKESKVNEEE